MDLESELRKAMAEEVAGTTAPPSLVADVKRRHRRRRTRIHAAAAVAAASVAAVALTPAYQSFRATPAGNPGTVRSADGGPAPEQPGRPPAPGPSGTPSAQEEPGAATPPEPEARPTASGAGEDPREPDGPGTVVDDLPRWIGYVPDGLAPTGPCTVVEGAERETTTCNWRGSAGWLEIAVVRGGGLSDPRDLMKSPGLPGRTSVGDAPALTAERPGSGRQISWLARPGVGVTVSAGGSVRDQLMRIAEGVRP